MKKVSENKEYIVTPTCTWCIHILGTQGWHLQITSMVGCWKTLLSSENAAENVMLLL